LDKSFLRATPLFRDLPERLFERLVSAIRIHRVKRGESVFQQGQAAGEIFIVMEGWVKYARIDSEGREIVLGVLGKGQAFGESLAPINGVYPGSAEAVANARIARLPALISRFQATGPA